MFEKAHQRRLKLRSRSVFGTTLYSDHSQEEDSLSDLNVI